MTTNRDPGFRSTLGAQIADKCWKDGLSMDRMADRVNDATSRMSEDDADEVMGAALGHWDALVDEREREGDAVLLDIADVAFGFKTLEAVGHDAEDFREVAVWAVKSALRLAYEAGRKAGK